MNIMPKGNMQIEDLGFSGKTVSFGTIGETLAIMNVRFELKNGRLFAVGEVPVGATNNDWAVGRPCAVAWDSVTDYMVFDSAEQYAELISKSE